jgi:hypothetical protein
MIDWIVAAVFVVAFLDGLRSTRELVGIHRHEGPPRNRITRAFAVVAIVCTAAAGYYGLMAVRRLMGFDPIPGAAIISIAIASAVLFLPRFLRMTVQRIRAGR